MKQLSVLKVLLIQMIFIGADVEWLEIYRPCLTNVYKLDVCCVVYVCEMHQYVLVVDLNRL